MNTDDIPIARIIENPKSIVKITIKNMPPPMPSNPEKNPTKRPVNIIAKKLKSNLASFSFLSLESKFLPNNIIQFLRMLIRTTYCSRNYNGQASSK